MTGRAVILKWAADLAARAMGLITFPVIAHHVGAAGYGAYSQVATVAGLVVPLASLGLGSVMVRYFSTQAWSSGLAGQILRVGGTVALFALPFTLAVWILAPQLNATFLDYEDGTTLFRWGGLLVLTGALEYWSLDLLRARMWLVQLVGFQFAQAILLVAATVLLLTNGLGLVALLQATIAIKAACVGAVVLGTRWNARGAGSGATAPPPPPLSTMIRFGLPLTVAGLGLWMVQVSDRLVIGATLGAADVGRYGIAYSLALLLTIAAAALNFPAYPRIVRAAVSRDDGALRGEIRLFHRYLVLVTVPCALWLAVMIQPLTRVLGGPQFHIAFAVPLLLVAALFLDQWNALAHYTLTAFDRTAFQQNAWLAAGALNVVLCVLLVPPFELVGAAVATFLCFAALELAIFLAANRHADLARSYRYGSTLRSFAAAAVAGLIAEAALVSISGSGGVLVGTAAFGAVYVLLGIALRELGRADLAVLLRTIRPSSSAAPAEPA